MTPRLLDCWILYYVMAEGGSWVESKIATPSPTPKRPGRITGNTVSLGRADNKGSANQTIPLPPTSSYDIHVKTTCSTRRTGNSYS